MNLRLIENKDIDLFKWDSCILNSINGLPYAYSWYLNIISNEWNALVLDNYDAVMPLLEEKFFTFLPYLREDMLAPQLGIFTKKLLTKENKEAFFEALTKRYFWLRMGLNKLSVTTNPVFKNKVKERFELDLINTYQRIEKNYHPQLKDKLKQAQNQKITVVKGLMPNDLLKLIHSKHFKVGPSFIVSMRILASTALRYRIGQIYGAYTRQNNICGAILFLKSNKKAIMLVTAFTDEALASHAIEYMVDYYLKLHAENDLTFIFENIGHRQMFIDYAEFGSKKMSYQVIKQISCLKKLTR